MASTAHQQRLMGTCRQEVEEYQKATKLPDGENVCLICGWSGGPKEMLVVDGENLFCPNCKENGKIDSRRAATDKEYMAGKYTRQSVADWKAMRKKLHVEAPQWIEDAQRAIVNRRAKGGDS